MADTDDSLTGTDSFDVLRGPGGDDTIDGGGSLDFLLGGAGNDSILGGGGNDILRGGSGHDTIEGGEGNDRVRGDSGDDSIDGGEGNDLLLGDAGADTIAGGEGNDTIAGGSGDDLLTGGAGDDTFLFTEGAGNDTITDFDADADLIDLSLLGEAVAFDALTITNLADNSGVTITHTALGGTITLLGVSKDDLDADNFVLPDGSTTPVTTAENDTLELWESPWDGTENSEIMLDDSPATVINALGGHDWVLAGEGNDTINGGDGYDRLYGEEGDDSIDGGADGDQLYGGSGDDYLSGGAGDDRLYGDSGSDTLDGGADADRLTGGRTLHDTRVEWPEPGIGLRLRLIRPTQLHVTFTLRVGGTRIRVISARNMNRKERASHDEESQDRSRLCDGG